MSETKHFDVLIVGAGLSGIGAAVHLQRECPDKTYAILEGRASMGGTWDIFRYPGIRSDSDMHTLGYNFKPWNAAKAIADGPAILDYIHETAAEFRVEDHIRYSHLVTDADWDSSTATWTVTATQGETGETVQYTANVVLMCAGYYSYKQGHTPHFDGQDTFAGPIIYPQFWPKDLDYTDKRVVVIGSGATAMTLVPAMTDKAAKVTMLQRSPTYVVSRPARDAIANALRAVLPQSWAYGITRWKNVTLQSYFYGRARSHPDKTKDAILKRVRDELGDSYDVETHFTPRYNPWDQRLCLVPDSDLFSAIRTRKAEVVTDHIDHIDPAGIVLKSGQRIDADIIVSATGLQMEVLGGAKFSVDAAPVDFSETWTYKGLGYSGVPNLVTTFGYINASWTLRADLIAEYACRLINEMDRSGTQQFTPTLRPAEQDMPQRPWIEGFPAGYMNRAMHLFPKQGDREPWINPQNYSKDRKMFREGELQDGAMVFSNPLAAANDPRLTGTASVAAE
ncbi:MAG: NAD(P)/FAD-dependent oxidoreductase [Pseudomonadota bacterium]